MSVEYLFIQPLCSFWLDVTVFFFLPLGQIGFEIICILLDRVKEQQQKNS